MMDENYLIETRRYLHAHPELSLREYETAAFIERQLTQFGIECQRVGETGVLGTIRGGRGAGKTVLLRADIDALPVTETTGLPHSSQSPGVMHACGHDLHTAALLGAAKTLQQNLESFAGLVLLVFQPAEEFGRGSRFFLEAGVVQRADCAFAVHVAPQLPVFHIGFVRGAAAAACDYFRITIKGKGAHITRPHQGVDALLIASLLMVELRTITSRLLDPFETALVGVGKLSAGTSYNVIAGEAVLEGTLRSFSDGTQTQLRREVEALAGQIAQSHGAQAQVHFECFAPALINNNDALDEACAVAAEIVGEDKVIIGQSAGLGLAGDDFGAFLREVKGVYAHIGTASKENPNTQEPLHSACFDIDERAVLVAARLYAGYALSALKEI